MKYHNLKKYNKLLALLTGGTIALSMSSFSNSSEDVLQPDITDVTASIMYDDYLQNEEGFRKYNIHELIDELIDVKTMSDKSLDKEKYNGSGTTKNYNGEDLHYDSKEHYLDNTIYYVNDKKIKVASDWGSQVKYYFDDKEVEFNSFFDRKNIIISKGDNNTVVELYDDNHCFIVDDDVNKIHKFCSFDSDDKLVDSGISDNESSVCYEYCNGDLDVYKCYENSKLVKEKFSDGSYSQYKYDEAINPNYLNDLSKEIIGQKDYSSVRYLFDKDGKMLNVLAGDLSNPSVHIFMNGAAIAKNGPDKYIFFDNNCGYRYISKKMGSTYVYNYNENGELINSYLDGKLREEVKDNFEYYYDDGKLRSFNEKTSDGIIHYNKDGEKEYKKDKQGYEIEKYENNKLVWEFKNGKSIYYYDYEKKQIKNTFENGVETRFYLNQNIEYVHNGSNKKITMTDINGDIYEVLPDGIIEFYENAKFKYLNNGDYELRCYESGNTLYERNGENAKSYYESGAIESISENGNITSYYENGTVKSYQNGEKVITMLSDCDRNIYCIEENGLTTFYYGDNPIYSTTDKNCYVSAYVKDDELFSCTVADNEKNVEIFHK